MSDEVVTSSQLWHTEASVASESFNASSLPKSGLYVGVCVIDGTRNAFLNISICDENGDMRAAALNFEQIGKFTNLLSEVLMKIHENELEEVLKYSSSTTH